MANIMSSIGALTTGAAPFTGTMAPIVAGIGGAVSLIGSSQQQKEQNRRLREEARRLEELAKRTEQGYNRYASDIRQLRGETRASHLMARDPNTANIFRQESSSLTRGLTSEKARTEQLANQYRQQASKMRLGQQSFDYAGAGMGLLSMLSGMRSQQREQQRADQYGDLRNRMFEQFMQQTNPHGNTTSTLSGFRMQSPQLKFRY